MVHALSEESLPPRVPLQCLTGDSAAAALNGAQRRPARHRRWKRRGLGGPGGAVGLALPTLRSASPVVEPRPTEEGAQPITLQHCSWEKTGAASEPVGYRVWLALGPVPPPPCHQTSCRSPSPHTCTATSLGQRLPAHTGVPLRAQTAHQPGCSHRCGQHRTGALGVDAGWSPRGCRGQGTTPAESPLRGTPMHLS